MTLRPVMLHCNKYLQFVFSFLLILFLNACVTDTKILQTTDQITALKSKDLLYIRTSWSASKDMVQLITLNTGQEYSNNVINFSGVRLIPRNAILTETAYSASKDIIAFQGDDVAPLNYNNTYIGANHGPSFVQQLTAASHGKTTADIGSEWIDTAGIKWYIMRIVDTNTLWVLSQNLDSVRWRFATTISGSTLTHNANAAHPCNITFAAATVTQLLPITAKHSKQVLLDGAEICKNGIYTGNLLTIQEFYNIPDIGAVLNYVKNRAGNWIKPPLFNDATLTMDTGINVEYQFRANGSCTVKHIICTYQEITLGYIGGVQANPLYYEGKNLLQYIPKTNAVTGSTKTWNFAGVEDITAGVDNIYLSPSTWLIADSPPDRMAQIVKDGKTHKYGFILGYIGNKSKRINVNNAGWIYTRTKKQYPKAVTDSIIPANSSFNIAAYRCFFNAEKVPEATVFAWYYDGLDVVVIMDFHQSVAHLNMPLPAEFAGKHIEVIEASGSFALQNKIVSPDGLLVTVNNYGYAIIKLRNK